MKSKRRGVRIVFFCAVALLALGAAISQAATVTWDGSGDMSWTQPDGTSWSGDTYNSGDDVVFTVTGAGTVSLAAAVTPQHITFTGGTYVFTNFGSGAIIASGDFLINGAASVQFGNMGNAPGAANWRWGTTTIQGGGTLSITRPNGIGGTNLLVTLNNGTIRVGADNSATYGFVNPITIQSGGGRIVAVFGGNATVFGISNNITGLGTLILQTAGGAANLGGAVGLRLSGNNSGFTGAVVIAAGITAPASSATRPGGGVWFTNAAALFPNASSVTVRDGGMLGVTYNVTDADLAHVVAGPRGGLGAWGGTGVLTNLANPLAYVGPGGFLLMDYQVGSPTLNRYADTTALAMNNIRVELWGSSTTLTNVREAVGTLTVSGGNHLILHRRQVTSGVFLLPSSIATPSGGNTLLIESPAFTGIDVSNATVATLGTAPSVVNGMITPAIQQYTGGNVLGHFVTLLSAGGTQFMAQATYTSTDIETAGATDLVNIGAAAQTLTSTKTVHALRLGQSLTLSSGVTLTLGSGGLIMSSVTLAGPGTLDFGSTHGVIGAYNAAAQATISAPIAGSGGLTIMGVSQTLNITGAGNSFTGGITINGSSVRFAGTAANSNAVHVNSFGRLVAGGASTSTDTIGGLTGRGAVSAWVAGAGTSTGTLNIAVSTGTYTFDGYFSNGASGRVLALRKTGAGTQIFSSESVAFHTGSNIVEAGTLILDGDFSQATGPARVLAGATLGGSGTLGGPLTTADGTAVLAPGASVGKLTLASNANFSAGATFKFELGAATTPGVTYDQLAIGGTLTGSTAPGGLAFQFDALSGFQTATPYTLITFGSQDDFGYFDIFVELLPPGYFLDTTFGSNGWLITANSLQVQFIPEPGTVGMVGTGLLFGLILWRLRQRRA